MSVFYVLSSGTNTFPFSSWSTAATTISSALIRALSGDTIYVSNRHLETQQIAPTWTSKGVNIAPIKILCVDDSSEPPTKLSTGAVVEPVNTVSFVFGNGHTYVYGIEFRTGYLSPSQRSISFNAGAYYWNFEKCHFWLRATGASYMIVGRANTTHNEQLVELKDCSFAFRIPSHSIRVQAPLKWTGKDSTIYKPDTNHVYPTNLFESTVNGEANCEVLGINLSAFQSGNALILSSSVSNGRFNFLDCQIGSASIASGYPQTQSGTTVNVINCDGTDSYSRYARVNCFGAVTNDTSIYRSGGANDGAGFSRKIRTNYCTFLMPLKTPWFKYWNEDLTSKTISVEIVNDGVTLSNKNIWLETEYIGLSDYPQGYTVVSSTSSVLALSAAHPTSSETWVGTGGFSNAIKQTVTSPSFTPQAEGWIRTRVCVGYTLSAKDIYVCPKVLSNSTYQYMDGPEGDIINTPTATTGGGEKSVTFIT